LCIGNLPNLKESKNFVKIVLDEIPPSINKYVSNSKNFNIYREDKLVFSWIFKSALNRNKIKVNKPFKKSFLMVIFFFPNAIRRDVDNYYKFIGDCLVENKLIKDDNFKNLEVFLRGRIDRDNPRTEIFLWELKKFEKIYS